MPGNPPHPRNGRTAPGKAAVWKHATAPQYGEAQREHRDWAASAVNARLRREEQRPAERQRPEPAPLPLPYQNGNRRPGHTPSRPATYPPQDVELAPDTRRGILYLYRLCKPLSIDFVNLWPIMVVTSRLAGAIGPGLRRRILQWPRTNLSTPTSVVTCLQRMLLLGPISLGGRNHASA